MHRITKNIFTSFILLFFIGCGVPPTIYHGTPIHGMHKLSQLKQDIATVDDVRNVMGEPSGYGKARIKPDLELLDIWFYQYFKSKGTDANVNMVIIFIDKNNIYQGHLAFIADSLLEDERFLEGLIIAN